MKKKISFITLHAIRNYGSVLQTLATQHIFESFGWQVEVIDFRRTDSKNVFRRIRRWIKNESFLNKVLKSLILYPTFVRQNIVFDDFLSKYIYLTKRTYTTNEDFETLSIDADVYCTGSDQTWNSGWNNGILDPLFLGFVPDDIRKISYAASFGKSEFDEWEKEKTTKLLKRYAAISVRESSGVAMIEDLGIKGSVHVLDPTLQLDKNFWQKYAKKPKYSPYVLIYQLNTNPQFDIYAKEYAKRKGLKLVRFCVRYDQAFKTGMPVLVPKPLDFVSLIMYADCVITDSFHATAFCINMNTPMISIYPNEYSSRLASILKLTGLENRHLKDYNDFSFEKTIDWRLVNSIIEKQRKIGFDFLEKALTIQ
ncbi:polysaccharide pyruvyl transferase family protein [Bacteroidales bacterium OttesenSCG-928-I21]|nr:polysaccharide pyruvyl transferase family protein [Bacteroidales bacterium OttesenSCG-928-I21]